MPRYGDAESVMWFDVEPCCMFHLINCFEDGDEVYSILRVVNFFHTHAIVLNLILKKYLLYSHQKFDPFLVT
jgi:hypothetical protein